MSLSLRMPSFPFLRARAQEEAGALPDLMAQAEKAAKSVLTGDHRQRKPGTGEKFWQFREYMPGDRPQDIDWRQSARGDRIFVRQKEWQTAQTSLFWCASGPGMDYSSRSDIPAKRQTALVLALSLSILMNRGGELTGSLQAGAHAGRTNLSLQKMGYALLEEKPAALPPAGIKIQRNANIVLCGDFLEDPELIDKSFAAIAAQTENGIVFQILDPAELTLPFSGNVIFAPPGHGDRHHIVSVESIRAAYRKKMEDHLLSLRDICRKMRWPLILHTTDRPVRETLAVTWEKLKPEGGMAA